jgi:peptide deformylase
VSSVPLTTAFAAEAVARGEAMAQETADRVASRQYTLRFLGDPILTTPATPVDLERGVAPGLVKALRREVDRFKGLGMAAQQVGGTDRVCVVMLTKARSGEWNAPRVQLVLINLRITNRSPALVICTQEGCLSVPGFRTSTRRHAWVDVEYTDTAGVERTERMRQSDAQIVQHELDHLDGKCIADGVSRQQRRQAERLVEKSKVQR